MSAPNTISIALIPQRLETGTTQSLQEAEQILITTLERVMNSDEAHIDSPHLTNHAPLAFIAELYQLLFGILLHPQHTLTFQSFRQYMRYKAAIAIIQSLFQAEPGRAHAHIEEYGQHLPPQKRLFCHAILLTPESSQAFENNARSILEALPPAYAFELMASLGVVGHVLSEPGERFRQYYFEHIRPSYRDLGNNNHAEQSLRFALLLWGRTPYFVDQEQKRRIKTYLNDMVQDYAKHIGLRPATLPYEAKQKPHLVVVAEFFTANHVLYTCYHQVLQAAFAHFDVTLAADEDAINDPLIQRDYPQHITLDIMNVKQMLLALQRAKPDIIFHLCVGSNEWGSILANLRIAPVQVATLGIPDSTFSDTIDYQVMDVALAPEKGKDVSQYYSEKLLVCDSPSGRVFHFVPRGDVDIPKSHIRETTDTVHIGVLGAYIKINYVMLDALRSLQQQSPKPLHFHFLPNLTGLRLLSFEQDAKGLLPNAEVSAHPKSAMINYLGFLNACDFAFSSFPFNNTNTIIDAFLVSLPVISRLGQRPPERTDHHIHVLSGTADILCTSSFEESIALALSFITDDAKRVAISHQVKSGVLNCYDKNADIDYYAKGIYWAYQNHPALMKTDKRRFDLTDAQLGQPYKEEDHE